MKHYIRLNRPLANTLATGLDVDMLWGTVNAWAHLRRHHVPPDVALRILSKYGARRGSDAEHPAQLSEQRGALKQLAESSKACTPTRRNKDLAQVVDQALCYRPRAAFNMLNRSSNFTLFPQRWLCVCSLMLSIVADHLPRHYLVKQHCCHCAFTLMQKCIAMCEIDGPRRRTSKWLLLKLPNLRLSQQQGAGEKLQFLNLSFFAPYSAASDGGVPPSTFQFAPPSSL